MKAQELKDVLAQKKLDKAWLPSSEVIEEIKALPRVGYSGMFPKVECEDGVVTLSSSTTFWTTEDKQRYYEKKKSGAGNGRPMSEKSKERQAVADELRTICKDNPRALELLEIIFPQPKRTGPLADVDNEPHSWVYIMFRDEDGSRHETLGEFTGFPTPVFKTKKDAEAALTKAGLPIPTK